MTILARPFRNMFRPEAGPPGGSDGSEAMRIAEFLSPLAAAAGAVMVIVLSMLPIAEGDPTEPVNMSSLKVAGLAGYPVHDSSGALIGQIEQVETDDQGRTRYLRIDLADGREARLSAFRARLDEGAGRVDLVMPLYAVEMAAGPEQVQTAILTTASARSQ